MTAEGAKNMSTRSVTNFVRSLTDIGGDTITGFGAKVYRHPDGYPSGNGRDLLTFFDKVEKDTGDTRFNDPSYLGAKWVVYLAEQFSRKYTVNGGYAPGKPWSLDFLSVGVCNKNPGDIEYEYAVLCTNGSRPAIFVREWRYPEPYIANAERMRKEWIPLADTLKADEVPEN
jgi:hypothetical protein